MNIQFTFKQMESSKALADLALEKLGAKIDRFTARPVHAHVTFSVEGLNQKVHVSLITADGHNVEAEHSGSDMYSEIDIVSEKVEAQLRKHKERIKARKGQSLSQKISELQSQAFKDLDDAPVGEEAIDAGDILKFEAAHSRADGSGRLTQSAV